MRYLLSVFFLAAASSAVAMPPPEIPNCKITVTPAIAYLGTTMRADMSAPSGGYITGATIAGKPFRLFEEPSTWVATADGTFTVEGTISSPAGTGRCVAEYKVLPGRDPKPKALLDLLEWPKSDLIYCRVKYFGSSDRRAGAVFDLSIPMGVERLHNSNENNPYMVDGQGRSAIALGESGLRLQLEVSYTLMACRSSEIPAGEPAPTPTFQALSISPLLYRGDTLLAPIEPVVIRTAGKKGEDFPGPIFNCFGQNYGGFHKVSNGRLEVPREPQYFETTTGNGVLQVKCSSGPDVLTAPFPPPAPHSGGIPTR